MPRRKPTEVIVQRIELGDWERDQIGDAVKMATLAAGAGTLAAGAGVAVAGVATWFTLRKAYGWKDEVGDALDKATGGLGAEVFWGRGTYVDPDTGEEVQNPFAGVPLLGSLWGSGVMLNQRFNPFWDALDKDDSTRF